MMRLSSSRPGARRFVVAAAAASILVAGAARVGAQPISRLSLVADGVYLYEHDDPTKAGVTVCNLVVVGRDAVLVSDGQGTVSNTQQLVKAVAGVTAAPITYVVVGSEHGDHRGGDSGFPATATFIAHPRSQAALERQAAAPERRDDAPPVVVPTQTVSDWRTFDLGGREVRVGTFGRSHTGGDLAVYLPRERVLYLSETFIDGIFPSLANGFPSEWVAALRKAEQTDATTFVPAHALVSGAPSLTRNAVAAYREALEHVIAEGRRLHDEHVALTDAPAQARLGLFASLYRYRENVAGALGRVYAELEGKLPARTR